MRRIIVFFMTAGMLLHGGALLAGTIYTWTDADGVKRYSDSPPPEAVKSFQTTDELQGDPAADQQIRRDYDQMVQDASQEADRHFEEQAEKKAMADEAEQNRRIAEQKKRIAAEREKLQLEIDAINGRALGPTFSSGQKAALIEQVQQKIDRLEQNPDAYFNP